MNLEEIRDKLRLSTFDARSFFRDSPPEFYVVDRAFFRLVIEHPTLQREVDYRNALECGYSSSYNFPAVIKNLDRNHIEFIYGLTFIVAYELLSND